MSSAIQTRNGVLLAPLGISSTGSLTINVTPSPQKHPGVGSPPSPFGLRIDLGSSHGSPGSLKQLDSMISASASRSMAQGGSPQLSSRTYFLNPLDLSPSPTIRKITTESSPGSSPGSSAHTSPSTSPPTQSFQKQVHLAPLDPVSRVTERRYKTSPQTQTREITQLSSTPPRSPIVSSLRSPELDPSFVSLTLDSAATDKGDTIRKISLSDVFTELFGTGRYREDFTDFLRPNEVFRLFAADKFSWEKRVLVFSKRSDIVEHFKRRALGVYEDIPPMLREALFTAAPTLTGLNLSGMATFIMRKAEGVFKDIPLKLRDSLFAVASHVTELNLSHCPLQLEDVNIIAGRFFNLRRLNLRNTALTNAMLLSIAKLENLEVLNVAENRQLSNRAMEGLIPLPLRELYLNHCVKIKNSGLQSIGQITTLEKVNFSGCEYITNGGFAYLSNLTRLVFLGLSSCRVTTRIFESDAMRRNLRFLNIGHCHSVDSDMIQSIAKLARLERFYADHSRIRDRDLAVLSGLRITVLSLKGTQVTDRVFPSLLLFPLQELTILKCEKITKPAVMSFVKAMEASNPGFKCVVERAKKGRPDQLPKLI